MNSSQVDINSFLEKYSSELTSKLNKERIKAQILSTSEEGLKQASEQIRNGSLVAFPTETVYGLGADALNEQAVRNIFLTKGRPLTDPLIVHVSNIDDALQLTSSEEDIKDLFRYLADRFWPGPLTCVVKADLTKIPMVITANTGFVGLRQPKAKIAQDLIRLSQRPIAAPSANLFSHVSPTSAVHVFNDFFDKELSIIDGERCEFGIESTVAKLTRDERGVKIIILRAGSLSEKAIQDALNESERFKDVTIGRIKKEAHVSEETNAEAPGMLLKHYSPYLETHLLELVDILPQENVELAEVDPSKTILIDFGRALEKISEGFLQYFSLSDSGCLKEAMSNLYSVLRTAENVPEAQQILILSLNTYYKTIENQVKELPEYLETVYDKSFRSASGKKIRLHLKSGTFFKE